MCLCRSPFILFCGNLIQNFPLVLPTNFGLFGYSVSETTICIEKSTDQKHELPMVAMVVNGSGRNQHFVLIEDRP